MDIAVFTFWNCSTFEALNRMIEDRYTPYDVKFEYMGIPSAVRKMKTETRKSKDGGKTNPQKAIDFLKSKNQFTIVEFKSHLNINNQGVQAIKRNKTVKKLFEEFDKTDKITYAKRII